MKRVPTIDHRSLVVFHTAGDKLIVLRYVLPTVKPPDATAGVGYETQPSTVRDEKGGGGTFRSIVEEVLIFQIEIHWIPETV